uniref:uncharacterized protein LOC132678922 isoform X1 n=1 Tax=Panthera onca TaxID=9690 RepID=UPI002952FCC9|nr:uncharacterized protein LOC132678922 isoform X1 [Panthera onca]
MNFLIIRGGRKALGPLGSGGSRPGPAPRERPSPSPRPALGSAGGRRHRLGASSCLCVWLSVDLSEALAAVYDSSSTRKMQSSEPRDCFASLEPSRSLSKTPPPRGQSLVSGKTARPARTPGPSSGGSQPLARPGAANAGAERKISVGLRSAPRLAGRWLLWALGKAGLLLMRVLRFDRTDKLSLSLHENKTSGRTGDGQQRN